MCEDPSFGYDLDTFHTIKYHHPCTHLYLISKSTSSMLTIRLARVGKKKHPTYRVVVQEKQKATSSNVLEILGHYNPHMNPAALEVKAERVQYWVSKGAQLSDTMNNLFVERKIVAGEKRQFVRPKKKEPPEGEVKTEALQAEATPEKGAIPPQPAP